MTTEQRRRTKSLLFVHRHNQKPTPPCTAREARLAKILIVDDEPSILRSTAALLESMGHEATTCAEAATILDVVVRERPDVLLQDVRMPGLDIHRLIAAIRGGAPPMRIVIFTASMDLQEVAASAGADAVLEKPFKPAELAEAVAPSESKRRA